jgi:hypothetical protein
VNNNPLNGIDPSGFEDLTDLAAGSAEEDPYNEMGGVGNGSSENSAAGSAPVTATAASSETMAQHASQALLAANDSGPSFWKSTLDKYAPSWLGGEPKSKSDASPAPPPPEPPPPPPPPPEVPQEPQAKTESQPTPTASQPPDQRESARTEAASQDAAQASVPNGLQVIQGQLNPNLSSGFGQGLLVTNVTMGATAGAQVVAIGASLAPAAVAAVPELAAAMAPVVGKMSAVKAAGGAIGGGVSQVLQGGDAGDIAQGIFVGALVSGLNPAGQVGLSGFWGGALNSGASNATNQLVNWSNGGQLSGASLGVALAGGGVVGGVLGQTGAYGFQVMPATTSLITGFTSGLTGGLVQGAANVAP